MLWGRKCLESRHELRSCWRCVVDDEDVDDTVGLAWTNNNYDPYGWTSCTAYAEYKSNHVRILTQETILLAPSIHDSVLSAVNLSTDDKSTTRWGIICRVYLKWMQEIPDTHCKFQIHLAGLQLSMYTASSRLTAFIVLELWCRVWILTFLYSVAPNFEMATSKSIAIRPDSRQVSVQV